MADPVGSKKWTVYCCNPYQKEGQWFAKNLTTVPHWKFEVWHWIQNENFELQKNLNRGERCRL